MSENAVSFRFAPRSGFEKLRDVEIDAAIKNPRDNPIAIEARRLVYKYLKNNMDRTLDYEAWIYGASPIEQFAVLTVVEMAEGGEGIPQWMLNIDPRKRSDWTINYERGEAHHVSGLAVLFSLAPGDDAYMLMPCIVEMQRHLPPHITPIDMSWEVAVCIMNTLSLGR